MKLILAPNAWLNLAVSPFEYNKLDAASIADSMLEIMTSNGGIGLAANQVGVDAQIFVMKPYLLQDSTPLVVINPAIVQVTTDFETMPEGCLSHPGLILNVKRPRGLVAKYLDITGKECNIELYDIDARCFLHEYDHLNGIEFTDRVSKLKLNIARKKLQKKEKTYG